ncbi:hypothetical protein EW145_g8258, partial [Phellinidium pouzarii]
MAMAKPDKKPISFATHITAGGIAGAMEALVCQPLDTIKVRMQLSRSGLTPGVRSRSRSRSRPRPLPLSSPLTSLLFLQTKPRGFLATGRQI